MYSLKSYIPIIAIIAFVAGLALTGDAIWTYTIYEPAEATVIDVDRDHIIRSGRRKRTKKVAALLMYEAKGDMVQSTMEFPADSPPEEGSIIPIRFNPSNTAKLRMNQAGNDFGLGLGSLVVGTLLLLYVYRTMEFE